MRKGIAGEQAFGTNAALDPPDDPPFVRIGGPDCTEPYDMALLNVSAMSFGERDPRAQRRRAARRLRARHR